MCLVPMSPSQVVDVLSASHVTAAVTATDAAVIPGTVIGTEVPVCTVTTTALGTVVPMGPDDSV